MPEGDESGRSGGRREESATRADRREVDLAALRARVEAADAFTLLPAELVQLYDRVRHEMLAAIDAAERRGRADPTLLRLARAWPPAGRRHGRPRPGS